MLIHDFNKGKRLTILCNIKLVQRYGVISNSQKSMDLFCYLFWEVICWWKAFIIFCRHIPSRFFMEYILPIIHMHKAFVEESMVEYINDLEDYVWIKQSSNCEFSDQGIIEFNQFLDCFDFEIIKVIGACKSFKEISKAFISIMIYFWHVNEFTLNSSFYCLVINILRCIVFFIIPELEGRYFFKVFLQFCFQNLLDLSCLLQSAS